MGKSMLSESLGRSLFEELIKNSGLKTISSKMGFNSEEELFLRLASSDISINQIIGRLNNEGLINKEETQTTSTIEDYINKLKTKKISSVGEIQSLKNLMHSFGKCCQPVPGENIIGVISRGRGVVIHREDCPNLNEVDTRRLVPVAWGENDKAGKAFATTLEVECIDRIGISRDILDKMANAKINILDVRVITRPTRQTALVRVSVEVPNIEVLDKLIDSLRRLSDVMGIKRYVLRSSGRSAK
jgi:(p)ppGpp synthase/HD superfamily hydrolase